MIEFGILIITLYILSLLIYFRELIIEIKCWEESFKDKIAFSLIFGIIGFIPFVNSILGIKAYNERKKKS